MPSESDLRDLLRGGDLVSRLDPDRIVAQSRRRRLPRQVGAGVVGVLAIAGIAVVTVPSFITEPPAAVSTLESGAGGFAADSGEDSSASIIKRAPAERINLCGLPINQAEPSALGLVLEVVFADSVATTTGPITGIVRMTNTSAVTVSGTTAPEPAIAVSQNGITVWHSSGAGDLSAVRVHLAPGESIEYAASFDPVRCELNDDTTEQLPAGLPPLAAGTYGVTPVLEFVPDPSSNQDSTVDLELVSGPTKPIVLTQ